MNQLESRMNKILFTLLGAGDFMTLKELADNCGVTRRSIQNYLQRLENLFAENGITGVSLIKRPGKGVKVLADKDGLSGLKKIMPSAQEGAGRYMYGGRSRQIQLLKLLLFTNEALTVNFLADLFYCSRSLILNSLEWVGAWVDKYDCRLSKIKGKGVWVAGDEICKRNAIAAFLDSYSEDYVSQDTLLMSTARITRVAQRLLAKYSAVYPKVNILGLASIIDAAEERFGFFLADEEYVTLLAHVIISVSRMNVENAGEGGPLDLEGCEPVRGAAEFIAEGLRQMLRVEIPRVEVDYICLHLMSSYIRETGFSAKESVGAGEGCEVLASAIIEYVEKHAGGRYSTDNVLYFELLGHLNISTYRIKNKIRMNMVPECTLELDARILDAVRDVEFLYKGFCGKSFVLTEGEVQALTALFMISRERCTQRARAVLLNSMGVVPGVTMRNLLSKELDTATIADVVFSAFQLNLIPANRYEFVISTVDLDETCRPVACIKNKSHEDSIDYLRDFVKQLSP